MEFIDTIMKINHKKTKKKFHTMKCHPKTLISKNKTMKSCLDKNVLKHMKNIWNKFNVKSLPLIGIGERPKGAYGCSSFLSVDDIKNETLSSSYGMPSGHSQLAWLIIGYYGYDIFYSNSPFVKILPKGYVAELKMVLNTNNALISLHHDQNNNLIICGVLDNLIKGASGQAVQNMNLALGFDETTSLI